MRYAFFDSSVSTTWSTLAVLIALGAGCTFSSPAASCFGGNTSEGFITCALSMAPVVAPSSHTRSIVYEESNRLRVEYGQACVQVEQAASSSQFAFRIQRRQRQHQLRPRQRRRARPQASGSLTADALDEPGCGEDEPSWAARGDASGRHGASPAAFSCERLGDSRAGRAAASGSCVRGRAGARWGSGACGGPASCAASA